MVVCLAVMKAVKKAAGMVNSTGEKKVACWAELTVASKVFEKAGLLVVESVFEKAGLSDESWVDFSMLSVLALVSSFGMVAMKTVVELVATLANNLDAMTVVH